MKPAIPKGTRDFGPVQVLRRQYITGKLRHVFELFGFHPIETPAMELMETLTGKYGEEGDKLLFRILNSGDFLSGVKPDILQSGDSRKLQSYIAEKGLRYDLTVPLARYVVMHRHEITFPFKRYQIQPVWRADRPQKGRYREFWQCDVDIIGSDSLMNEVELIRIADRALGDLKIPVRIRLNHRKILEGLAETFGIGNRFTEFTTWLDKTDKIGIDGVCAGLRDTGFPEGLTDFLSTLLNDGISPMEKAADALRGQASGEQGLQALEFIFNAFRHEHTTLSFDLTLARGLNYYTGTIFEISARDVSIGSICGGGRYDNLTGLFGLEGVPGVGISFGLERIYDVMEELGLFPATVRSGPMVLIAHFDETTRSHGLRLLVQLQEAGIASELYPDLAKMKKQMKYANAGRIPWVVIVGETEMQEEKYGLRDMATGNQEQLPIESIIQKLQNT